MNQENELLMTGYSSSKGEIILDNGAINAIKIFAILPAGIIDLNGNFSRGDIVGIKNSEKSLDGELLITHLMK